ncbi:YkuS family protein [Ornithinibacillus halotolerans]|uniref:UPF0180 protein GCM10008025_33260 n=1 Tax=Ornithinibacillus halotolerans TaxID=1274357 RepID=A0A916S9W3_9BACI|nr:YkuS family protein [Ornithinibacillus halotolerans]GGA87870.1 UPF0180 protein [Ornithinibacillus halotolerans]
MARIGVEESLADVKEALMEMGHEVVSLNSESDTAYCDCCVISGLDKDVMGIGDTTMAGPVINASGHNADEIAQKVNEKLS